MERDPENGLTLEPRVDAWAAEMTSMLSAWMVYDFRLMYAHFQEKGFAATKAQQKETRRLLGHEPRSFRAFADEAAGQWRTRAVAA